MNACSNFCFDVGGGRRSTGSMGSEGKAPEEAQDRKRWDYDSDTAQELADHISKRVEGDQNFINYGERLDESERKTAVLKVWKDILKRCKVHPLFVEPSLLPRSYDKKVNRLALA